MESRVIFLIFICFSVAESEIHTLEYIYTALSKPLEVPGVYEFTTMGILDNEQIDYYNSKNKTMILRQTWMSERLENYSRYVQWRVEFNGTPSHKSKEQWFKVSVEILMTRMNHSKGGLHVLQWRHGCQGEPQPDGTLSFREGFDQYNYDGGDFLSFDPINLQWVAPVSQAVPTNNKWNHPPTLNQYTEGYLNRDCMGWLNKFMDYGEKDLKNQPAPMVFIRSKTTKTPGKVILHCLATGLYSRHVEVNIYRNNDSMTEADGVTSTGIRPSEFSADGTMAKTYQLKKSIEILESDLSFYSYNVIYRGEVIAAGKWEPQSDLILWISIGVTLALALLIIGAVVAVFLCKNKETTNGKSTTTDTEKPKLRNGEPNGTGIPEAEKLMHQNELSVDRCPSRSETTNGKSTTTDREKLKLRNGEPNGTGTSEAQKLMHQNGEPNGTGTSEAQKLMHQNGEPNGTGTSEAQKLMHQNGEPNGTGTSEAQKLMHQNGEPNGTCNPEADNQRQPNG